ncbi:MAG: hypothetical protein E7654_01440 [Ruminococcaceae bacterium]|nr:hypothetical protein [Oscillospiraceae bacterium]
MRSCLYFLPFPHDPVRECLHKLPSLSSACQVQLILELQVDAVYPASAIAEVLGNCCGKPIPSLNLTEDTCCIPLAAFPHGDARLLLAAAGVDAAVQCRPLLILRGADEVQYRQVRDRLAATLPRELPVDAGEGFTQLPPDELIARGKALGLALPENCLLIIADYYRAAEHRDPTPEELLILDAAYRGASADAAVCAPITFTTDDPRCHAAYADLMEKRRALSPEANAPATLGELANLAAHYLAAHSGHTPVPRHTLLANPRDAAWQMAALGTSPVLGFTDRRSENTALYSGTPIACSLPTPEDRLLWVEAPQNNTQALEALFHSPAASLIRRSLPVPSMGLIPALGRLLGSSGLGLCLSVSEDVPPTKLLQNEAPGVLLLCDPRGGRAIPDALRNAGLRFRLIAAVEKAPFFRTANNRLRFPAAMLAPRPAITASVSAPYTAEPAAQVHPLAALTHDLQTPTAQGMDGFDPRTAPVLAQSPTSAVYCKERVLAALACTPAGGVFSSVQNAALALIFRLTAQGASPEKITLAVTVETPPIGENPTAAGRVIAALLALHTVQVELGIHSEPAEFAAGDVLSIRLSASAPAPAPRSARTPARHLWLAVPCSVAPHLNGQRAVLAAAQRHAAAGGFLIPTEQISPLAAALRAALYADCSLRTDASPDILQTPLSGGMLFASDAPPTPTEGIQWIPFAELCPLGENAVIAGDAVLPLAQALPAMRGDLPVPPPDYEIAPSLPRTSCRHAPRPRVIIPACTDAAVHLAQAVAKMGGEPLYLPFRADTADAAKQSITAIADSMEKGHILLLGCSEAVMRALLAHPRFAQALSAFRAADGLVCVWGGAFSACLAHGIFSPEGKPVATAPLLGQRMLCSHHLPAKSPWTAPFPAMPDETVILDRDPRCPVFSAAQRHQLAELGCIAAHAAGTPDGCPAVTALTTADGGVLGLVSPPTPTRLTTALEYFR